MAKVLYRKYRPRKLAEVVGQEQVTSALRNAIASNKISHAYLFVGPRGTGKTSVARIFAHEVNNFKYEIEDSYVDIIEIDGASNRGIDDIRELREKAMISPTAGKYKIYIIDEVHMLTKEAFNALLKILEEPPKHVIFIMATTDAYKVPITITSRAQTYVFNLADQKTMFDYLNKICQQEKIDITEDALNIIVRRGGGSFRDSLSLLGQVATLSDKKITKEIIIQAMGLPEDDLITHLLEEFSHQNTTEVIATFKKLITSGVKPEIIAEEMIQRIIAEPKVVFFGLLNRLPEVKAPFSDAKLLSALVADIDVATATPKIVAPEIGPKIQESPKNNNFEWNHYLNKIKELNDAVYSQLIKSNFKLVGDNLIIIPSHKLSRTILSRDGNLKILNMAADGKKVTVGEPENSVNNTAPKDSLISKISDIMGGEVKNDQGGNPF